MKRYLAIMASLVTSTLFNVGYADIVIPESGLLVCTPDRPYTVSKENGSIGIEEDQKPCIVEAEENPFILYSIYKSDYCIDMDYIGSQCGKGGSGGSGEASGPFPDKLNWNDTNKLAEYNQGRYNMNRGQFFDKGIGGCIRGSSLNFSGEISSMADCDNKDKKITALVPKPDAGISVQKTRQQKIDEYMAEKCSTGGKTFEACRREIEVISHGPVGRTIVGTAVMKILEQHGPVIRGVFSKDIASMVADAVKDYDEELGKISEAFLKELPASKVIIDVMRHAISSSLSPEIIRDSNGKPIGLSLGFYATTSSQTVSLGGTRAGVHVLFMGDASYHPLEGTGGVLETIKSKISGLEANWQATIAFSFDHGGKELVVAYEISTRPSTFSPQKDSILLIGTKPYYYRVNTSIGR